MANKIRYTAKENKKVGTHYFYAVPVLNGTLDTDSSDGGGAGQGGDGWE